MQSFKAQLLSVWSAATVIVVVIRAIAVVFGKNCFIGLVMCIIDAGNF